MSVPHPGGDPNANLYAQLKRDVLDRVPQISAVEFVPDDIEAKQLRATFDPVRLDPPTGPDSPELTVKWYRQDPDDWFRINYTDPNTGFHAGWHQDEDHPNLGQAHFQYSAADTENRWGITFDHETPSLILWEIVETLLEEVHPEFDFLPRLKPVGFPSVGILGFRGIRTGVSRLESMSPVKVDDARLSQAAGTAIP